MTPRDGVTDLYATYALAVDGGDLALLKTCFARESVYEVVGHYRVEGRSEIVSTIASRRRDRWTHITSNVLVTQRADDISGRASFVVLDEFSVPVATGEYADLLVEDDGGRLVFARRIIHYRGRRAQPRERE